MVPANKLWNCVLILVALLWSVPLCSATPEGHRSGRLGVMGAVDRVLGLWVCSGDALLSMATSWRRTFPSWVGSDPCVNWAGVTCAAGRVTGLNLSSSQLTGPVSPAIGQLTLLLRLDLSNNDINGPFPPELSALQSLQLLNLNRKNLISPFSPEILQLKNLIELRYDVAGVFGQIPDAFSNLQKLEILHMGQNTLSGFFPDWLMNIPALKFWICQ